MKIEDGLVAHEVRVLALLAQADAGSAAHDPMLLWHPPVVPWSAHRRGLLLTEAGRAAAFRRAYRCTLPGRQQLGRIAPS